MKRYERSWFFGLACMLLFLFSMGSTIPINGSEQGLGYINTIDDTKKETLKEKALSLSNSYFIQNVGQIESDEVMFYSGGGEVYFTPTGVLYRFREMEPIQEKDTTQDEFPDPMRDTPKAYHEFGVVLKYSFLGANRVNPEGMERCSWNTNYFKGRDPDKWFIEVANYKEVVYSDLWDGIDLFFRLKDGAIKYDLIIHPGADPARIGFKVEGHADLDVNGAGDLVFGSEYWNILDTGLVSFYTDDHIEKVRCDFKIINNDTFCFDLCSYDGSREIINDPELIYSTFIGGSSQDSGYGIAVDPTGNAYVTGGTYNHTTDYPTTTGAYDTTHNGGDDVFVTKLNTSGSSLLYSTFIGGSSQDSGYGIAVDSTGYAYVTGYTDDDTTDYPTTAGAYDTTHNGWWDVFVTKLSISGSSLVYSSLIGGSGHEDDYGNGIAVDSIGNAFVTGITGNDDYPTTVGVFDTIQNGGYDVFVTKLDSAGSSLLYSTFIGGSDSDCGYGIAVDPTGNAYVTGFTMNGTIDYPTTTGAYDTTHNGWGDVFVTKLNTSGSSLVYSTFIGGSDFERGYGIAVNPTGNAYVTGYTMNGTIDYPTTTGAYDTTHNGGGDVFVTKLSSGGSSLLYSTFIGGLGSDDGNGIAVDPTGNAYVTGGTYNHTTDYPTTAGAYDTTHNGERDVFVSEFILDQTEPTITDLSNNYGTTGDPFHFNVQVSDTYPGVEGVFVEYWFGTGPSTNATMRGSEPYTFTIIIPSNSTDGLHYIFHAKDTSDNWKQTKQRIVTVLDNDGPVINMDTTTEGSTGDPFIFKVIITDNIKVNCVDIEYWYGEGPHNQVAMDKNDLFVYELIIPNGSLDSLHYIIHANDTSDNWNATEIKDVTVLDDDRPYFAPNKIPASLGTGQDLHVPIRAYDNIGIYAFYFEYWFGLGSHTNLTLKRSGEAILELHIPDNSVDSLNYTISAIDTSGNWASIRGTIEVVDTITPVITSIPDMVVDEDKPITFNGSDIYDNIGIVNWSWGVMWKQWGDDVIFINHDSIATITFIQPGFYSIWLNATDAAGNWEVGLFCSNITVRDITPPHIENRTFSIGEDASVGVIYAYAEDNVGIVKCTWAFQDQGVIRLLSGRSFPYSFSIPGTYNITVLVEDAAGNMASGWILLTVTDLVKPVVDAGPDQIINKGVLLTFEGNGTDDGGIINWTWSFEGRFDWILYGKIVTCKFTEPGTYTVTLKVMDSAGNSMSDSLIVTVRDFIIDDGEGDVPEEDGTFLFIIIALAILSVIIVSIALFFVLRKKKEPSGFDIERSEDIMIPPELPTPEPTSIEPTSDVSVSTSEPTEPTPQPPVMDEAPLEKEVDGKPKEDIVVDPDHLEDPASAL